MLTIGIARDHLPDFLVAVGGACLATGVLVLLGAGAALLVLGLELIAAGLFLARVL